MLVANILVLVLLLNLSRKTHLFALATNQFLNKWKPPNLWHVDH